MPTFTAMYNDRADAERVQQQLTQLGIIDTDGSVGIHDRESAGFGSDYGSPTTSTMGSTSGSSMGSTSGSTTGDMGNTDRQSHGGGFFAGLRNMFVPDEDSQTYGEGVRRGHALLTVKTDEQNADRVHQILEDSNAIDVDEKAASWKKEGWMAPATGAAAMGTTSTMGGSDTRTDTLSTGTTGNEQRIPVVEEQLAVGKREVERGGVRVRSYVKETPVQEQVSLREEHVHVERNKVDQPLSAGDLGADAFKERDITLRETAEEAVVAKNARVVEEVVVSKDVENRTETVSDTVRKTDVDVEQLGTSGGSMGGGSTDTTRGAMFGSERDATDLDRDGRGAGSEAAGMGNETIGNVKQGLGSLTGSESLKQSGEAQERRGEQQDGRGPDTNR